MHTKRKITKALNNFLGQCQCNITCPEDFENYVTKTSMGIPMCTICEYTQNQYSVVKNHVESKHFPNTFQYDCPLCSKHFGTSNAFVIHKRRIHAMKPDN